MVCRPTRNTGVERVHRTLRHQRDAGEPQCSDTILVQVRQPLAGEPHLARLDAAGRLDHAQNRQCQSRFARTGFTCQAEPLAWGERKAHVVDRLHLALRVVEADAQALNLQDWLAHMLPQPMRSSDRF